MSEESSQSKAAPKCNCGCSKRRTYLLFIGGGVIVAGVIALYILAFQLGAVVRVAVQSVGSKVTGCPVTIQDVNISFLSGSAEINNFVIGNPPEQGFKTDHAVSFERIYVSLDVWSLLSDTIIVESVEVKAPKITYEVGLGNSNIGVMLDNVKRFQGEPKAKESEKPKTEEPADGTKKEKRLCIGSFSVEEGSIIFSAKMLQGKGLPVPLPPIHLKDVGGNPNQPETQGATVGEVIAQVFGEIFDRVLDVANKALDLLKDGAEAVGRGVEKLKNLIFK